MIREEEEEDGWPGVEIVTPLSNIHLFKTPKTSKVPSIKILKIYGI